MTSKELFALAASELDAAKSIEAKATEENRPLTAEEEAGMDNHIEASNQAYRRAELVSKAETAEANIAKPIDRGQLEDAVKVVTGIPKPAAQPIDHEFEARCGFRDIGEFAMSVYKSVDPSQRVMDRRLGIAASASGLEQAYGPSGGYLVPPAFANKLWDGLRANSQSLMGFCDQYTVEGESLTIPAVAESSRADGSRWGGVRGYWKNEADQMTSSKPAFRQLKLEPHELYVFSYVTDKLLKNASALEQFLTRAATDEISFKVGNAIVNGTGAGQPLGIMNASCLVSVAKETSQAADTILTVNLLKARARMHPSAWANAKVLINSDCIPQLSQLFIGVKKADNSDNVSGFASPVFNPESMTLFGKPVIECEYCATIGDTGDILFVDFGGIALGTRGGVQSAMSIHLRFDYNETCFRWIFEVDAQPYLASALTPFKGSNTQSTFVKLDAR